MDGCSKRIKECNAIFTWLYIPDDILEISDIWGHNQMEVGEGLEWTPLPAFQCSKVH